MWSDIPDELKVLPQWVCANEGSKAPLSAKFNGGASVSNPEHWVTYRDALPLVLSKYYDYLGFVFADNGYVGIDVDCGFDDEGYLTDDGLNILSHFGSYVEKSKSGRGFHIICKGGIPFPGANNGNGVEIYKTGRYFIVTGNEWCGVHVPIVKDQEGIDWLLDTYFKDIPKRSKNESYSPTEAFYRVSYDKPVDGRVKVRPNYPIAEKGCRNHSMASYAGQLHGIGYSKKQIYDEVLRANKSACKPPLSDREIRQIVNSICKYERL